MKFTVNYCILIKNLAPTYEFKVIIPENAGEKLCNNTNKLVIEF